MAGITGRQVKSAYAPCNTWGVSASVTVQVLLSETTGFDVEPMYVDDDAYTQSFKGMGEVGDFKPTNPELSMQLRFEQGPPAFLAQAMGSAAAPSAISSQGAANSLVAYSHVLTMASELASFVTLASDFGGQYVQEIPSLKIRGFSIKVGPGGRLLVSFPVTGNKTVYDSTKNTTATLTAATIATPGNRAFRKNTTLRINRQAAGSLAAADISSFASTFTLKYERPVAEDYVLGSDSIVEADDDGWFEGELEVVFARMNTVSANSIAAAYVAGTAWKADLTALGTYINSATRRSLLFEMPALEPSGFSAVVVGHNLIRPTAKFKLKLADAAPTGMSGLTNPLRITVVNAQSTNLITLT